MKNAYLKKGLVKEFITKDSRRESEGFFDLKKWLKKLLNYFKITFFDQCCDAEKLEYPVRYNSDLAQVEYFNGTEWVAVQ